MSFRKYDEIKWGYSRSINTFRAFFGEALDENDNVIGYVASNFRGTDKTPCYDRTDDYFNRFDIYIVSTTYIGNYQMYDKTKHANYYSYYKNSHHFDGFKEKMQNALNNYYIKDITDEEMLQLSVLIRATKGYLTHLDNYISCLGMGKCYSCGKYDMAFNIKNINGSYCCEQCISTLNICPSCGCIITDTTKTYNGLCLDCAHDNGKYYVYGYHDYDLDNYEPRGDGDCYFGIELEFNSSLRSSNGYIGADVIKNKDTADLIHFERDGSITGFEMISQPCSLDYWKSNKDYLQGLLDEVRDSFKTITDNNGFHVHISTKAFKGKRAIARFITINSFYKEFLINLARRTPTDYCTFIRVPLKRYYSYIGNNMGNFSGHHTFINLHTSCFNSVMDTKTIEVRYFKSTFDANEVIETLEMLKKMIDLANGGGNVYYEDLFKDKDFCKAIPFNVIDKASEKSVHLMMKQPWFYSNNILVLINSDLYSIIGYDSRNEVYILGKKAKVKNKEQKSEFRKTLKEIDDILVDRKAFYKNGNDWKFIRVHRGKLESSIIIMREAIKDVI